MRRKPVYIILSVFVIFVLLFFGFSFWLLRTSNGAEWLIASVSKLTHIEISFESIEGRLWDNIKLDGLQIKWSNGNLTTERVYLKWQPLYLITGNVAVREFSINSLQLTDNSPGKKPDFLWPKIGGLPGRIDGWIDSLQVDDFYFQRRDQQPLRINKIFSKVVWYDRILTLKNTSINANNFDVKGTVSAGFDKPLLYLDLGLLLANPVREMDYFHLKTGLTAGKDPVQIRGLVDVVVTAGFEEKMHFSSEIELAENSIKIERMLLTEYNRRGKITGKAEIDFRPDKPDIKTVIEIHNLDMASELHISTNLHGMIALGGNPENYSGTIQLSNSGEKWMIAKLSGAFQGNREGIDFVVKEGTWLNGNLEGKISGYWAKGYSLSADIRARDLNPAILSPEWKGIVNFDISGKMQWPEKGIPGGELSAKILRSRLHGKSLTGDLKLNIKEGNLIVDRLLLQGRGFDITARGELQERLSFLANITDLSGLIPESRGRLRAKGWVGIKERLRGSGTVRGQDIGVGDLIVEHIDFDAELFISKKQPLDLKADLKGLEYRQMRVGSLHVETKGSPEDHNIGILISNIYDNDVSAKLTGAYKEKRWEGKIVQLSARDSIGSWRLEIPADLYISDRKFFVSNLVIVGREREKVKFNTKIDFHPVNGFVDMEWANINLARSNQWLHRMTFYGSTSGKMKAEWEKGNIRYISASVDASVIFVVDEHRMEARKAALSIDWNSKGLSALLDIQMKEQGKIKGKISAPGPVRFGLPEKGDIDIRLTQFDAAIFRLWLPEEIDLHGIISARIQGKLLPENCLDIAGNARISGGSISHITEKGELSAELRTGESSFIWQEDKFRGDIQLVLIDYGNIRGDFLLPIPARLPVSVKEDGMINISLKGKMKEKGLLTSIFPGLIQESHGRIELDVKINGIWKQPRYGGEVKLSDAGAYLPTAGITIKDVVAKARISGNEIIIDNFYAKSGKGNITGSAEIGIEKFSIKKYKGSIRGENFQALYLPELQAAISPDLTFEGKDRFFSVKGEIKVPELFVYESEKEVVKPSKDVVIIDEPEKTGRRMPFTAAIDVRVVLGSRVFIKMEGLDAQLKGSVDINAENLDDIKGNGMVQVVKGRYKKYGIDLNIERGRAVFAGGPIDKPALDILAIRQVDDVKAGIFVIGTPQSPIVNLYSEPPMSDTDILSYIVLGHPPTADQAQIGLLSRAAGILLSKGESATLQAKLQQRLGVDMLDIEAGGGDVARSALTVGKYLSPRLYISYGISLFTGGDVFRLRYRLSKRWELETESGVETGIDLFYKIDIK
ncbi:MAG: translocation/assembly module TamB domain-containing protein [Nitrospirae bacterium]|nr:translocation/assembly module TamB domain-containing protein [Nitrospirota bacterium]